jgi:hypothetical protein
VGGRRNVWPRCYGECRDLATALVRNHPHGCYPRQVIVARAGKEVGLEAGRARVGKTLTDLLECRATASFEGQLGRPMEPAVQPRSAQADVRGYHTVFERAQ